MIRWFKRAATRDLGAADRDGAKAAARVEAQGAISTAGLAVAPIDDVDRTISLILGLAPEGFGAPTPVALEEPAKLFPV